MQTILRRSFPGVVLLLIAVVAYLQVRGTAALIEALLISPSRGPIGPQLEPTPKLAGPEPNPAGLVSSLPRSAPRPAHLDTTDPLAWPVCSDVRALIVTESRDPTWSLATLQGQGEAQVRLRRAGDGFAGRKVAFIGFNPRHGTPAVWLEGKGELCQSPLFGSGPLATVTAAPALTLPRSQLPETPPLGMGLFRQLRVVPEQQNGKLIGLRLFGVRPGSLLATLGLKNGDRLETINGFSIANPEQALQAYARLRTADHLRLRLNRAGQPLEIDLNIS